MQDGSGGRAKAAREAHRLHLLRFVDSFAFSFAWIAVGLLAGRKDGTAGFAAVTAATYAPYTLAMLMVGPAARRFGARTTARTSAIASGALITAAMLASYGGAEGGAPLAVILALMSLQSLAGSTAVELMKYAAARQKMDSSLSRMLMAHRTGQGAGALLAGLLIQSGSALATLTVGAAAALVSSGALAAGAQSIPEGIEPQPLTGAARWMRKAMRGNGVLAAMTLTVGPTIAVSVGHVAEVGSEAMAGALGAALAVGALAGPGTLRYLERKPEMWAPASMLSGGLLLSLRHPAAALLAIPMSAVLLDAHVVSREKNIHRRIPEEPGALAVPGILWSLGVGGGSVPAAAAIQLHGPHAAAVVAATILLPVVVRSEMVRRGARRS